MLYGRNLSDIDRSIAVNGNIGQAPGPAIHVGMYSIHASHLPIKVSKAYAGRRSEKPRSFALFADRYVGIPVKS